MKNKTVKGEQILVLIYSVVQKGLKNASINHEDEKELEEVERYIKSKRQQKEATYAV